MPQDQWVDVGEWEDVWEDTPVQQPQQKQSIWNRLTTPDVTVNIPENVTGWKRVPGEIYNKFIGPMTSPLGAAATVGTAALGGPLASLFPRGMAALGMGFGGYNAVGAVNDVERMTKEGINPSNAVDLMGHSLGSLALPFASRMGRNASQPSVGLRGLLDQPTQQRALPPARYPGTTITEVPYTEPQVRGLLGGNIAKPFGPQRQQMLPAPQSPAGLLPAFGETSTVGRNTPTRFNQGIAGVADSSMQYPYQMQPGMPPQNAGAIAFPNATQPVPGGKLASVTIKRPGIYTPDTGPEIAAGAHTLQLDPMVANNVFGRLLPGKFQQGKQVPITPPMVPKGTPVDQWPVNVTRVNALQEEGAIQLLRDSIASMEHSLANPELKPDGTRRYSDRVYEVTRKELWAAKKELADLEARSAAVVPFSGRQMGMPNQINYPPTGPRTYPEGVLPQYSSEMPRGIAQPSTTPPGVLPQYSSEFPRGQSKPTSPRQVGPALIYPQTQSNPRVVNPNTAGEMPRASNMKDITGKPIDPVQVTKTAEKLGWNDVREALNLSRAIITTGDFGALLRQGANNIHKKAFWTSVDDMFKSFGSEKFSQGLRASIETDPFTAKATRGGLNLSDLKGLNNREESIMSTWVEEGIPFGKFARAAGMKGKTGDAAQKAYASTVGRFVAKPFNRAHTDFLNKVRVDDAKNLYKLGTIAGKDYDGKDFGEWQKMMEGINIATGRATFPKFADRYASAANSAFLAPRYSYSQWQMINPIKLEWRPWAYMNSAPSARKEQMKSLLAGTALGSSLYGMYKMAGGETQESDPQASDFMKVKFGDKIYMDPWGGKQQQVRLMSKILDHVVNGAEPGPYGNNAMSAALNYGRTKLAPVPGFFVDYATGKDMAGQPFEMRKAIAERAFPIVVQDMVQILQEDPEFAGMIIPSILGTGMQVYNKPVQTNPWFK